jgi:sugar phosphate isomerase/epimerase
MKLSVSNIAWDAADEPEVTAILRRHGVAGIEVAPTKLWPDWVGATPAAAREACETFAAQGFLVPALQAILFGRPDLHVFGDAAAKRELVLHVDRVAALAAGLGAGVLVFGSPKNRDPGERTPEAAQAEAREVFRQMGAACARSGVRLCIEPNPKVYACNFMTSWRDVLAMVEAVDHEGVAVHLDTACIALEGDDVVEAIDACAGRIAHFHVTEPELRDFASPTLAHAEIGKVLRRNRYDGWLSIEMRRSKDPLRSVDEAVTRVLEWYA